MMEASSIGGLRNMLKKKTKKANWVPITKSVVVYLRILMIFVCFKSMIFPLYLNKINKTTLSQLNLFN